MSAHAGQGPIAPQEGDWLNRYEQTRDRLEAGNAYDRASERDACGVGLVVPSTARRAATWSNMRSAA